MAIISARISQNAGRYRKFGRIFLAQLGIVASILAKISANAGPNPKLGGRDSYALEERDR
jgi:hypothetical protein